VQQQAAQATTQEKQQRQASFQQAYISGRNLKGIMVQEQSTCGGRSSIRQAQQQAVRQALYEDVQKPLCHTAGADIPASFIQDPVPQHA